MNNTISRMSNNIGHHYNTSVVQSVPLRESVHSSKSEQDVLIQQ